MHFFALVVTEEKPTEEVIGKVLKPFGPDGGRRWDHWALGGRYTGNLIPLDLPNTLTGGPDVPEVEMVLDRMSREAGLRAVRSERPGPGVDALQLQNLKRIHPGVAPLAVVAGDNWYECEVHPIEPLAQALGLQIRMRPEELDAERSAVARWLDEVRALLESVPEEHWLAVIDCHV